MKRTNIILTFLVGLTLTATAQTADTLTAAMELRLQNVIGSDVFMAECPTPSNEIKGLPTDTSSFRLYEQRGIVCLLARNAQQKDSYFCAFDMNKDLDFSNDYHYYFTRKQIQEDRTFLPQRHDDIWIAPRIRLNGVAGRGGKATSPLAFDELFPMLSIHDFFVGHFDYHGKTFFVCSVYDKKDFAILDSIPVNDEDLARDLVRHHHLRDVQFPIIRDSLIFRILDMDFSRQQCRLSITPLTDATMPTIPYEGFRAPTISASDIKGKTVALGNTYTLLDFWGSWCNPCIAVIPELVDIHRQYLSLRLVSIAVENSMKDLPKLKRIIKEREMDWTHICQLHSDTASIAKSFSVSTFPTTVLIDSTGKIIYRGSGRNNTDKLKAKLREIFGD